MWNNVKYSTFYNLTNLWQGSKITFQHKLRRNLLSKWIEKIVYFKEHFLFSISNKYLLKFRQYFGKKKDN